ncbi:sugar efflux transporter for intercellular exchange-domain-containing protein [Cladochytrium replicatum]|nr:sugar efflux transporter for intercellular exchange-domain-containing protein [Cladochytrium replicatum]
MPIDCGTSAVCSAIVNYAVPGVGCITTAAIFLAPWAGVVQVTKRKSLGEVNPVPFAWMCCNSLGWVVYGQKVQNYFVAVPNVVGYLFGIHYFLTTYPFATIRQRKLLFLILFLGSAVVFSMAVVANIGLSNDAETSRLVLGYTAVAILIVFYSSPLSTLYDVIKRRDASSLGPALAIASAVNGGFWSIYGFAINDAFVFSPNLVGAVVGIVQLILIGIFGRGKSRTPLRQDPENDSLEGATSARDT